MQKVSANDEFMTTREAAQRLGVALRTVQLWVESGVLPAWKTAGGHRRVARTAVERLARERQQVIDSTRDATSEAAAIEPAPGGFRMMLVDDDPRMLKLIGMAIESWGMPIEVSTASNGFDALLQMGHSHPHLLLTDLFMPGMDGFEMIRALRGQQGPLRELDILVMTGLNAYDIAQRGGLPEDVRVFNKPVPLKELKGVLEARVTLTLGQGAA